MDVDDIKKSFPNYENQIKHIERVPPKSAETVRNDTVLSDRIARKMPFESLYVHQAKSLESLDKGNNVCVTTPTSSGKTLIYALRIAQVHQRDDKSTSLLIYPTKALSQDQKEEITDLYDKLNIDIDVGVYDGDTSRDRKRQIRNTHDVIITNFQGLNYYLAYHKKWDRIFRNLETVVVDESHTYTGVHGTHVAWIMRRLLRIVRGQYHADPSIVLSSATIGNPKEHSYNLTGCDFDVIEEDGSPRGKRDIVIWNPPSYTDDSGQLRRRSSNKESSDVLSNLVSNDDKALMFSSSRKSTEICAKMSQEKLDDNFVSDYTVEPYNAGHMKEDRRDVEDRFKQGDVDGVVSTSALELGIDIGDIDSTVMNGYPGRRASFWQQAGRSGRGTSRALSVLVTKHDSIDQYIVDNPDFLLEEDVENAVVDLSNKYIFSMHLCAAANESPLSTYSLKHFGDGPIEEAVEELKSKGLLKGDLMSVLAYCGPDRPESNIDIYSSSDEQFDVYINTGSDRYELPPVDKSRAFREFHPNAIYMYKGNQYSVESFDTEKREVELEYTDVNYYTQSSVDVRIKDIEPTETTEVTESISISKGRAKISESYGTYSRIYFNKDKRDTQLPTGIDSTVEIETDILWIEINDEFVPDIVDMSASGDLCGSLHAAEHALIKMSPTILTADSQDLGGISMPQNPKNQKASIFLYDGIDGGVGFCHEIYNQIFELSRRTQKLLEECECDSDMGCPACTMSPMCGDNNEPMDSVGASYILQKIHKSKSSST